LPRRVLNAALDAPTYAAFAVGARLALAAPPVGGRSERDDSSRTVESPREWRAGLHAKARRFNLHRASARRCGRDHRARAMARPDHPAVVFRAWDRRERPLGVALVALAIALWRRQVRPRVGAEERSPRPGAGPFRRPPCSVSSCSSRA
jgi:hypothetical protein